MTIQAIETRYAGCRFRSRLEARWAVFFDKAGIPWEYEPQGFHCTWRLDSNDETFPYLPDFWLPEENVWAEVKGSLDIPATWRLLNAAASLSSNNGGGCGHENGGKDLVVLGHIPDSGDARGPVRLHMHKGDLQASPWSFSRSGHCIGTLTFAHDGGFLHAKADRYLIDGMPDTVPPLWRDAFTAARSARFEHGEVGA